ncbi:MAG: toll/interleukin-1 receptor domain-containing protein [Mogibacterium sp.]|nr:toll/interleukin-1 receptor domain-containing protein [Mogibacterium sp.]
MADELNAYQGNEPYIFVSYMRSDKERVMAILNILERRGFRLWYDYGIHAGDDWRKAIEERIDSSKAFLSFISENASDHGVVVEEIQRAVDIAGSDPDYKIVFVFLDKVSPSRFPKSVEEYMRAKQFIDLKKVGGITNRLKAALCLAGWPEGVIAEDNMTDKEKLRLSGEFDEMRGYFTDDELFSTDYEELFRNQFEPSELVAGGKTITFYKARPEQIDTKTVYPIVMDNQWVPDSIRNEEEFRSKGFAGNGISVRIVSRQREEVYRSLLHNNQIVVNRASIINSEVFASWYKSSGPEHDALGQLFSNGDIVIYLHREHDPVTRPQNYDYSSQKMDSWLEFCSNYPVYCLRMDWIDESNDYETVITLDYKFQNFCLTIAENSYLLDRIAERLGIIDRKDDFRDCWLEIQKHIIDFRKEAREHNMNRLYTRDAFYRKFLIADGSKVNQCVLDLDRGPFVWEKKQVIDYIYSTNLPAALGITPLIPLDNKITPDLFIDTSDSRNYRELSTDELIFSVDEFRTDFLSGEIYYPDSINIGLEDILKIRSLDKWKHYMSALSEGRKKSHLDQTDYYDIFKVWKRFADLMEDVSKIRGISCRKQPSAVSVIYKFEGVTLTTVYRAGECIVSTDHPLEEVRQMLRRKVLLEISYVCTDVLRDGWQNILISEEKLFEGITADEGSKLYDALLCRLQKMESNGEAEGEQ